MSGYADFALFYDRLTENVDYKAIAAYYDALIKKHGGKNGGRLLDLACGTGTLSLLLKKLKYAVTAVDGSQEMLSVAASKPHRGIQLVCQDMTKLKLGEKTDYTICSLDSINHLRDAKAIAKTFAAVGKCTEAGGLFLFDINTLYKHEKILADRTFVYDLDGLYCVWQNEYVGNGRVNMSLDFFVGENGAYSRYYDELSEIALPLGEITEMLEAAGFETAEILEYLTDKAPSELSEKLTIIARKK